MKFEFELDGIDTQNLHCIFMSYQRSIMTRIMDAESGRSDWVQDIPSYIRGCVGELRDLDRMVALISSERFIFNSGEIIHYWIMKYGENTYDNDGNYSGYYTIEPGKKHI